MITCEINIIPKLLLARVEADIDKLAQQAVEVSGKIDKYKKELEGTGIFEPSGQRASEGLLVLNQSLLVSIHEEIRGLKDIANFLQSSADDIAKVTFQI